MPTMNAAPELAGWLHGLEHTGQAIALLASSVQDAEARWRPQPHSWSVLEIINHLADEESDDFRTRLTLLIKAPTQPWPRIDPHGWAQQRRYNERDLGSSIERFLVERQATLKQLGAWPEPNWALRRAGLSAADLMASWQAHDLLHLRQLAQVRYLYLEAQGLNTEYAGSWPGLPER